MTNGRELKVVNLPRISTFGTWSYCHCKHVAADGRCYRGCQQRVKGQCLRHSPTLSPVARKCKSISPIFTPQNYAGTCYKILMPWWMQYCSKMSSFPITQSDLLKIGHLAAYMWRCALNSSVVLHALLSQPKGYGGASDAARGFGTRC